DRGRTALARSCDESRGWIASRPEKENCPGCNDPCCRGGGKPFPVGPGAPDDFGLGLGRGFRCGGRARQGRREFGRPLDFAPAFFASEIVLLEGLGVSLTELLRDVQAHEIPFLYGTAIQVFSHIRHCCSRSCSFVTPKISARRLTAR